MDCIGPTNPRYNDARRISNARFDLKPGSICYPATETGVQQLVRSAQPGRVRVRSGGHNHEGMCSGDGVTIIDVSKFNCINIRNDVLTVGPGARLGNIYDALWEARMLLPGGGCGDVCVGGLVQGGGWGPYSRRLGLTCDRLIGFRMVKADGTIVDVSRNDSQTPDLLFWGVAGGGGGNFGVVTELRFKLEPLGDTPITTFTVSWRDRSLYANVIADWGITFPFDGDTRLTSFCRLTKLAGGAALEDPIIVAGNYLGDEKQCEQAVTRLLPATWGKKSDFTWNRVDKKEVLGREVFQHPEYQPGPPAEAV